MLRICHQVDASEVHERVAGARVDERLLSDGAVEGVERDLLGDRGAHLIDDGIFMWSGHGSVLGTSRWRSGWGSRRRGGPTGKENRGREHGPHVLRFAFVLPSIPSQRAVASVSSCTAPV